MTGTIVSRALAVNSIVSLYLAKLTEQNTRVRGIVSGNEIIYNAGLMKFEARGMQNAQ
jgi:hypothetical protein